MPRCRVFVFVWLRVFQARGVVLRCAMLVSPHWPTAIQEAVMVVALTTRLSFKQVFYGETDSW